MDHIMPISLTATGRWAKSTAAAAHPDACNRHMCTKSHHTWIPDDPRFVFYDNETACSLLVQQGIKLITFQGDSFQRHLYAALLITLNGDYQYGSLAEASKTEACAYGQQFHEKQCSVNQLNHFGSVCRGQVTVDPALTGASVNHCQSTPKSVLLWSFGNHGVNKHRKGVNNATVYADLFRGGVCQNIPQQQQEQEQQQGSGAFNCSIYWISTHYRRLARFPDEDYPLVRAFNLGMREFFDSGACGGGSGDGEPKQVGRVGYVDVYNMTAELVRDLPAESAQLTYDNAHWGMEVNLIKAQILLNALLRDKS